MGMIGKFLASRCPAQEDAILTGRLIPASPMLVGDGRCIIGHGSPESEWSSYRAVGVAFDRLCSRLGGATRLGHWHIDYGSAQRGAGRVGEMIRARILRNRARRVLQSVEAAHV